MVKLSIFICILLVLSVSSCRNGYYGAAAMRGFANGFTGQSYYRPKPKTTTCRKSYFGNTITCRESYGYY